MGSNAYDVVRQFEEAVAEFAGAKYGVAVESGTAALFLSIQYMVRVKGYKGDVFIPKRTYPSVPCSIMHAGLSVRFHDEAWKGVYKLDSLPIIDAALRFRRGMYQPGTMYCLSFHAKKILPIGRGGMILTNSKSQADWIKRARFDGRPESPLDKGEITFGWNMYMTPEQAARGLMLLQANPGNSPDLDSKAQNYPDLSKISAYKF